VVVTFVAVQAVRSLAPLLPPSSVPAPGRAVPTALLHALLLC